MMGARTMSAAPRRLYPAGVDRARGGAHAARSGQTERRSSLGAWASPSCGPAPLLRGLAATRRDATPPAISRCSSARMLPARSPFPSWHRPRRSAWPRSAAARHGRSTFWRAWPRLGFWALVARAPGCLPGRPSRASPSREVAMRRRHSSLQGRRARSSSASGSSSSGKCSSAASACPSCILPPPSRDLARSSSPRCRSSLADFRQTFLKAVLFGYAVGCLSGFLVAHPRRPRAVPAARAAADRQSRQRACRSSASRRSWSCGSASTGPPRRPSSSS